MSVSVVRAGGSVIAETPIGAIQGYAGTAAPTGWLLCDGTAVSRSTYSELFGVVSTTYGSGDGSTTFNLPNITGYIIYATRLSTRVTLNNPPEFVTALPSSPLDGKEIYYQADGTNGVIWHLRYRSGSSSSYKWEFIGGASLKSKVGTSGVIGTTNLSTYTAPATRPSITVPLNGDYEVRAQADAVPTVVSANTFCNLAIFADGTVKSVSRLSYGNGYYPSITTQLPLIDVVTGVAGTRVIDVRYSTSATTSTWEFGLLNNQILHVTPVRVG